MGKGLPLDLIEGAKWVRRAAEAGEASAQSSYGNFLRFGSGVEKNLVEAIEWYRKAAAQGDKRGEYHLGICYARGLGIEKDFEEARKWLELAARKDYRDSKYQLRRLFFLRYSIFNHAHLVAEVIGTALLAFQAIHAPVTINFRLIGIFVAILFGTAIALTAVLAVLEKLGIKVSDKNDLEAISKGLLRFLKRPWRIFLIPAEDGFCLLPLLYIGIAPVSAAVAAFVFAAAHYPSFPWRYCIPKGIAYFFVALFILPFGIWSIVVGHLIVDVNAFMAILLAKMEWKPTCGRFLKVLREE